jgi:hypothetical protein
LVLGYPVDLVGEQNIFGGVITKVSDKTSETFGGLKLTDLTPVHVKTVIAKTDDGPALGLVGCTDSCTEDSKQELLITIPIVGVDQDRGLLALDLAALGQDLDLVSMLDPDGSYTGLKAVSSKTTAMDFSLSTLVFDVETTFVPKPPAPAAQPSPTPGASPTPAPSPSPSPSPSASPAPTTTFTVRWYLKLSSGFTPAFVSRSPIAQVGFFKTERAKDVHIQRFAFTEYGNESVHYYIKNVPDRWQAAFKSAFDEWNEKLKPIIGRELLSYEFVPAGDPKNNALVPGDVRYNIIEWDLVNKASYGGLGPSIANQFTGETFSAAILIQGPSIMDIYTDWFKVSSDTQTLRSQGRATEAEEAMLAFMKRIDELGEKFRTRKVSLKLGSSLAFRVASQQPELEDPLTQRNDFDETPDGYDFQTYMDGYFHDMLAHEMGHNLGLRHNFRGSLAGNESAQPGTVSRSVMEYLNRSYRYLDHIGVYDVMAITYGYTGKFPDHDGWFCTDEDNSDSTHAAKNSAECSKDDATDDPFSFYQQRLARALDKIMAKGSIEAPVWTPANMAREIAVAINGLNAYASSAAATASGWTNFFGKPGRPADASGVRAYVLAAIKAQLCDPSLQLELLDKLTPDARSKTQANLDAFRAEFAKESKGWGAFSAADLACGQ